MRPARSGGRPGRVLPLAPHSSPPAPTPAPVPRLEADDPLAATLARRRPIMANAGATIQREINIVGPDSQETPESVWNAFQAAAVKTTTRMRKKRGRVVILAWCYSMDAFNAVRSNIVAEAQR